MFVLCSTTENQAGVSVSVPAAYFDAALPCRASATKSRVQRSRAATTTSSGASAVRGSTAAARPQNQPMSSTTRYYCTYDNNTVRRPPLCVPPGLLGTRQERSRHGQILTHPLEAFTCSSCSPPAASPRQAGRWPSFYRPARGAAGETR